MPSSIEKVRCPECGKDMIVDVETQYEGDVRITAIRTETEYSPYDTGGNYEPPLVAKQSHELVELIKDLKFARARFDRFNLEVAQSRVKGGISDNLRQLYKLMGSFDRQIQELITEAKVISTNYSWLKGEDEKP